MIDLSQRLDVLTDEECMVRDSAKAYCSRDPALRRVRGLRAKTPSFDLQSWREMAEMGWLGSRIAEDSDTGSLTHAQLALLLEQVGRALAPEPLAAVAVLAASTLKRGDNPALKEQYLRRLAAGDWIASLAWQESPGSQAAEPILTRAKRQGKGYVLDGCKCFVPVGEVAHAFIVSAAGAEGTMLFLLQRNIPGLSITTHTRVDGGTWSELHIKGVEVGDDQIIARAAAASSALERSIDEARVASSAELLGVMSQALELTVDYMRTREQFGARPAPDRAIPRGQSSWWLQHSFLSVNFRQIGFLHYSGPLGDFQLHHLP